MKPEDVVADYAGRDTYNTCYRARHLFGVTSAVLVTNQFHTPRAVFIARGLGIDAVGYGVKDFELYPELRVPQSVREYLADIKTWWDVEIGHREARIMGTKEASL